MFLFDLSNVFTVLKNPPAYCIDGALPRFFISIFYSNEVGYSSLDSS